ncbi:hypothetical protein [Nesterenkonia natronophila]|uniref:Uncharacterized protein n=1 Tax=Nesterenkonia natronophila TaxID=2174932 RepID=A0A3A4FKS9_9MICC|nr:hypothetical protein [Nesterenkonia natronophila]RJN33045.1 hypothetical protein D3250_04395 [Nesterenkonia natronophila]
MRPDEVTVHSPSDEAGQTTVLILGMMSTLLMFAAVILGATMVNGEARQLLSEADGAVSAAAVAAQPVPGAPQITEQQVRTAAEQHLAGAGAHERHAGLAVIDAGTSPGGQTIYLHLRAEAQLPGLRWVLPSGVEVTAESHARIAINR